MRPDSKAGGWFINLGIAAELRRLGARADSKWLPDARSKVILRLRRKKPKHRKPE